MAKQAMRSEELRRLFDLPDDEDLIEEFNCALLKKVLLQGKVYIFESHLCFYSNIFGSEKAVISLASLTHVYRAKTAGVFPNAIEVLANGRKYFFCSFLNREDAYRHIVFGWARKSGHARLYLGKDSPDLDPVSSVVALKWESKRRGSDSEPTSPRVEDLSQQAEMRAQQSAAELASEQEAFAEPPAKTPPKPPRPECHTPAANGSEIAASASLQRRPWSHGRARSDEASQAQWLDGLDCQGGAAITGSAGLLFSSEGRDEGRAHSGLALAMAALDARPLEASPAVSGADAGPAGLAESSTTLSPPPPSANLLAGDTASGPIPSPRASRAGLEVGASGEAAKQEVQGAAGKRPADEGTAGPRHLWSIAHKLEAPSIPASMCKVFTAELKVTSQSFFDNFFSDESIPFLQRFHSSRGDQDVNCTSWTLTSSGAFTRELSFRHPMTIVIGLRAAACRQTQRVEVFEGAHVVIRTEQTMADIPYCDYFSVVARWDVVPREDKEGGVCQVTISMEVPFTKKILLQTAIEKGAVNESRQVYHEWMRQAQEVLLVRAEATGQLTSPAAKRSASAGPKSVSEATARICQLLTEARLSEEDAQEIRRMLNLEKAEGSPGKSQSSPPASILHSWNGQSAGKSTSRVHFQADGRQRDWFARGHAPAWLAALPSVPWRKAGTALATAAELHSRALLAALLLCIIFLQVLLLLQPRAGKVVGSSDAGLELACARPWDLEIFRPGSVPPQYLPSFGEEAALWWDHRLRQLQEQVEYELAKVQMHMRRPQTGKAEGEAEPHEQRGKGQLEDNVGERQQQGPAGSRQDKSGCVSTSWGWFALRAGTRENQEK